jgi:release factor glutamine methyltransferase
MTLGEAKKILNDTIPTYYYYLSAEPVIRDLLMYVLGISKVEYLCLTQDYDFKEYELSKFEDLIKQLKQEKPIQYILGEVDFLDFKLKVNEDVLIPRPETEQLVCLVRNFMNSQNYLPATIIDIGTGSGCIALAMKKWYRETRVIGLDISYSAIDLAKINANKYYLEVEFYKSNILQDDINLYDYDVLISNPPYVYKMEKNQMNGNVTKWEPHIALFVPDDDPIIFYKKLIKDFSENKSSKFAFFEINPLSCNLLVDYLKAYSHISYSFLEDHNKKTRYLVIKK